MSGQICIKNCSILVGCALCLAPIVTDLSAVAQDVKAADPQEVIRASASAFAKAFQDRDAVALAKMWKTDGEYIDESSSVDPAGDEDR